MIIGGEVELDRRRGERAGEWPATSAVSWTSVGVWKKDGKREKNGGGDCCSI